MSRRPRKAAAGPVQRTYYIAAEYIDSGDRLLVEDGADISLYSIDLALAQHWYAAAWRGARLDLDAFLAKRLDWRMEPEQARSMKGSGLVLARCLRHGKGMPVVDEYNGQPIYGSAVEVLIGEVFEGALSHLIEEVTGIAGLTISPMHTGYAIHDGRPVGSASVDTVADTVTKERSDLGSGVAPDGTVTLFFSDIENSTALNEKVGDQRWMQLLRDHNAIVRREMGLHHGFEIKTIGDAFMIAFQGARDAVRCALSIQQALATRKSSANETISIRIGLHTGELTRERDDFYGWHVNFAARVASQAAGGEILVSSLLRELVEPSREFTFEALAPRVLKGFRDTHVLHAVKVTDVSTRSRSLRRGGR